MTIRVLLVDDDREFLELVKFLLDREGTVRVEPAESARAALDKLGKEEFDAVVSDYQMPEMDGIELLKILRVQGNDVPFILLTGKGREEVAVQALNNGADFYLYKGSDPKSMYSELINMIKQSVHQRKADVEVREARRFMLKVFDSIQDGISVLDKDLVIKMVNPTMEKWYAHSMPLVGKKCYEAYHGRTEPCDICPTVRTLDTRKKEHEMVPYRGPNSEIIGWLDLFSFPLQDMRTGELDGVIEYVRDATEQRKIEDALKSARDEMEAVVEASPVPIVGYDVKGRIMLWNPASEWYFGWGNDEAIGRNPAQLLELDKHEEEALKKAALKGDLVTGLKARPKRKDGSRIDASLSVAPLRDADQNLKGAILTVTDITEFAKGVADMRKALEDHVELETILTKSPAVAILWRIAPDWPIEFVSANISQFGYDANDLMEKHASYDDLIFPEDLIRLEADLPRIRREGITDFNQEYRLRTKSGDFRWVDDHTWIRRDANGEITHHQGIIIDVTERKMFEEALKAANEKLNLLGQVTRHDSLNQLAILIGWIQVAEETASDPKILGYLKNIKIAAELVQKQLDFAGDYQKMGVAKPVWASVLKACMDGTSELIPKGVVFDVDLAGLEVRADPMFEKVFHNLVENSLRHGEKVTRIGIHFKESVDGLDLIYEDDGSGVPDDQKVKIFRKGEGRHTGFGLFVVDEILRITGMTIKEMGKHGEGARFVIHVPRSGFRISRP